MNVAVRRPAGVVGRAALAAESTLGVAELEERQPLLMNLRRRSTHLVLLLEGGAEELGDGAAKSRVDDATPASVRRVFGNEEAMAAAAEDEYCGSALC
jgi:hypothetical protein